MLRAGIRVLFATILVACAPPPTIPTPSSQPVPTSQPSPTLLPTPTLLPVNLDFRFDDEVSAGQRALIQQTILMARERLGRAGDVTVYAFGNLENLLKARMAFDGFPLDHPIIEQRRALWQTNIAETNDGVIFLNTASSGWQKTAVPQRILFHEYFHLRQIFLGKPRMARGPGIFPIGGPLWLLEGSAEYAAYRALAHYGLYDWQTARREKIAAARGALLPLSAMERNNVELAREGGLYPLSFVAAEFLANEFGEEALVEKYWRGFGAGLLWESAFETAFGMPIRNFYLRWEAYRREQFPAYCSPTTPTNPLTLTFAGRLPPNSFPAPSEAHIPYAFCLAGADLFLLARDERDRAIVRPPESAWYYNGNVLIIFLDPAAPTAQHSVAVELPDGRRVEITFMHSPR